MGNYSEILYRVPFEKSSRNFSMGNSSRSFRDFALGTHSRPFFRNSCKVFLRKFLQGFLFESFQTQWLPLRILQAFLYESLQEVFWKSFYFFWNSYIDFFQNASTGFWGNAFRDFFRNNTTNPSKISLNFFPEMPYGLFRNSWRMSSRSSKKQEEIV